MTVPERNEATVAPKPDQAYYVSNKLDVGESLTYVRNCSAILKGKNLKKNTDDSVKLNEIKNMT